MAKRKPAAQEDVGTKLRKLQNNSSFRGAPLRVKVLMVDACIRPHMHDMVRSKQKVTALKKRIQQHHEDPFRPAVKKRRR